MPGKIAQLVNRKIAKHTWSDLELWLIGRGDVGEDDPRNLTGPQSRMIWIHQGTGDDRKVGTAVVSTSSGIRYDKVSLRNCINLECWVGKPDTADPNSKTLHVKELSPQALNALNGLSPMEQADNEAVFTDPANLTNLRVEVIGAKEVNVTKGTYTRPSDSNTYKLDQAKTGFNGNDSIASLIPGSAGQHRVAWICVARETGKVKVVASTAVAASGTLPQRSQLISAIFTISVNNTYKRLIPVYLYNGQSEIAEVDLYRQFDARFDSTTHIQWVSAPASAASTGTAGQVAYDSSYLYICTATDTWKRVAISTW